PVTRRCLASLSLSHTPPPHLSQGLVSLNSTPVTSRSLDFVPSTITPVTWCGTRPQGNHTHTQHPTPTPRYISGLPNGNVSEVRSDPAAYVRPRVATTPYYAYRTTPYLQVRARADLEI